jgi:hypothetical protein
MNAPLSKADAARFRETLVNARRGTASLVDLAAAHDLAVKANLRGCEAELAGHMRRKLDNGASPIGREVILGVATGALTHYLMRGI